MYRYRELYKHAYVQWGALLKAKGCEYTNYGFQYNNWGEPHTSEVVLQNLFMFVSSS